MPSGRLEPYCEHCSLAFRVEQQSPVSSANFQDTNQLDESCADWHCLRMSLPDKDQASSKG